MKNIANFAVNRAITVFMAVIIVVVFGVVSYTRLTTDLFPSMNIPYTVVVTTYIGASPEEVEEVITEPLEATLATTTNVKEVTSQSQENVSLIIMEFNGDANMDSAVIEMRENLDMVISTLPEDVGNPMIIKLNPDMMPVMQLSVSQEGLSQQELTKYVEEDVLPQIERVPGVASVSVSGAYESEVRVVIDDAKLADLNSYLTAFYNFGDGVPEEQQVLLDKELLSTILSVQNFEFPVGYVNSEGVNYLVRVGDDFSSVDEINDLILFDVSTMINFALNQFTDVMFGVPFEEAMENPAMVTVLESQIDEDILYSPFLEPISLSDIAAVSYVNANEKEYSKINGENAISFTIQKSASFATTDVTKEVLAVVASIEDADGTEFTTLLDQGEYIEQATGSVSDNLLVGAALAIVILIAFLRSFRATIIVGLAIPISLLFAIVLIYLSGITLNIVSLGGLALGIGMLVDNSIVVMENIFRMKKLGYSNKEAAIQGTTQVGGAIIASTITTIAVFLPIIFIEGFIKEIFMQMAMTITFSLIASLLVALSVVPAISSKILKENEKETEINLEIREPKYKLIYQKVLEFAFRFKYVVLVVVVLLFGGSIGLALQNGFEYIPASDEGQLTVSIANPNENPMTYSEFVTLLDDFTEEVMLMPDVETIGITLGSMQGSFMGFSSGDEASASIILKDDREASTTDFEVNLENLLSTEFPEVEYSISGSQQTTAMLTGNGIQVEITGYDIPTLQQEAKDIATLIEEVDGIKEVDSGVGKEAYEYKITVDKDEAIKYNLMVGSVLGIVASTISPEEMVTQISVEGTIYDLYVYDQFSNTDDTVYTITDLENIPVGFDQINQVPVLLGDIAEVQEVQGATTIAHINGARVITVSAEYEDGANTTDVAAAVEEALEDYEITDGYTYSIQGEQEEAMEAVEILVLAMVLAVALIYMIMASQFQSLTYPFIIMFTIPLAFTGGFAILWIAGMKVSVVALIGLIILVGVVVNNGIVLVDYINQLREQDYDLREALIEAGKTRLRPIVMTALTTILALITMAIGVGQGAEMMQPMAVTTIGGLTYATFLTLLVVPIMYELVTVHGRSIFGYGTALVIAIATGASYYMLSSLPILIGGSVATLALVIYLVVTSGKKVEVVE